MVTAWPRDFPGLGTGANRLAEQVACLPYELGRADDRECLARAVAYLRNEQEENGSWFGRWGTN